ncbi:MAG: hypothetical protein KC560_20680, partial [Myxococcales bacterium]|nr:hypothetical protein [Myxococcales bacterium]
PALAARRSFHFLPPSILESASERYCAWYGEARDGVLYFGMAPFWSAMRDAGGDPSGDLRAPGPQAVGRFDLRSERMLPPLDVAAAAGALAGTWDVLPHPNGRVYFTTFFEPAGWVEPASGAVVHLGALGLGLNELALGPGGAIGVSRYGGTGGDPDATGSLVVFAPDGALVLEAPLAPPDGFVVAPKTIAWDPGGERWWIATDLVRRRDDAPAPASLHPAIVLDAHGRERARIEADAEGREIELQFVRFAPAPAPQAGRGAGDGAGVGARGVGAVVVGDELRLAELAGGADPHALVAPGRGLLLDAHFPRALDFVQDVAFAADGAVLVTRWSGIVHVVREGRVESLRMPRHASARDGAAGLYYAAAATPTGDLCATVCDDAVAVECAAAAPPR